MEEEGTQRFKFVKTFEHYLQTSFTNISQALYGTFGNFLSTATRSGCRDCIDKVWDKSENVLRRRATRYLYIVRVQQVYSMFPATGTSHIALKRQNIGIFIRKTRTVSSDTSRVARVFFQKWKRFKDFEIISIFLYVILHTIRRISSFSAKIYRLQSVVKVSMKKTIGDCSFFCFVLEKIGGKGTKILSQFIYLHLFIRLAIDHYYYL